MAFISIIIPTYNRSASLLRAIDSVHKNSESDIEIIVVDDGSNDGTTEEVKKLSDSRIRYHRQDNKGVCASRVCRAITDDRDQCDASIDITLFDDGC